MRFAFILLTLFALSSADKFPRLKPSPDACTAAYLECAWEFLGLEGTIPTFPISPWDNEVFTPQVISKDRYVRLGILEMNYLSPEFILSNGKIVPIKKVGLTTDHFKPYPLPKIMGSGIGHQTFDKEQYNIARGKCVRVFFTHYQLFVGGHPPDVRNIVAEREDFKCVVFKTARAPAH